MKKAKNRKIDWEIHVYLFMIYRNFPGIYALGHGMST